MAELFIPEDGTNPQYIIEDSRNNLWFADPWDGDIAFYERKTDKWSIFNLRNKLPESGDFPFKLTGLAEDKNDVMLFTTTRGLVAFDQHKNEWQLFTPKNSGLPDTNITCIYKDKSGRIWLGTGKGIVVLAP